MRRVILAKAAAWVLLSGCGSHDETTGARAPTAVSANPSSDFAAYLSDASFRRSRLEASLVNVENGYSRLRLDHYSTGAAGDWDTLPEWNPATELVSADSLSSGLARADMSAAEALDYSNLASPDDHAELLRLGHAAFERYPAELAPCLNGGLASLDAATRYGLWVDAARGVGGLVNAQMADGSTALSMTCSTCHATKRADGIENGAPNAKLDLGKALVDANPPEPVQAAALAAWGPGRIDVTTATGEEPARIVDLRPVKFLTHLQQDATVKSRDTVGLAIRIETLIITSSGQVLRAPREISLALAVYVESLADTLVSMSSSEAASPRGSTVFREQCSSCHVAPALTGPPVPLGVVGTDPVLGLSMDRGTGMYRVPSLHGVGSRGPLLHDGTVPSIAAFLDPARVKPGFVDRLHGEGPVPGHLYGLDLSDSDRAALIAYLKAL